jgi:hypothetical protein
MVYEYLYIISLGDHANYAKINIHYEYYPKQTPYYANRWEESIPPIASEIVLRKIDLLSVATNSGLDLAWVTDRGWLPFLEQWIMNKLESNIDIRGGLYTMLEYGALDI